jgi:hypothetical protein
VREVDHLIIERARGQDMEYDYNVTFVGSYWTLVTKVSINIDENIGNVSEEARELAMSEADRHITGELGISPLNFAHSCLVMLELEGEEITL